MNNIKIIQKNLDSNYSYDGTTMVNLKIEFPQLWCAYWPKGAYDFNYFYIEEAKKLEDYAKGELYTNAVEDYKYVIENDFPFNSYTLQQTYKVTSCESPIVSLFRDTYQYTGGAHGMTNRSSETWNLFLAKKLVLDDLFIGEIDYKKVLIKSITKQALERQAEDPSLYFNHINENIIKYLDEENFYLTYQGIAIFYPLYTLGPYVSGIQAFIIPYDLFL